ncbi:ATP-binding protein [Bacillus sp. FJAT-29814]|uniref:ATP-binding protein n=1 Tax=Bacillus sp. FJAT-29814 TaxID=1729688 RepID=UPI000836C69C|nr:ATP-binding protein [Bacillus sp. FJAT-29814]
MQIGNLLFKLENQWFVGREKELSDIAEVSLFNPSWRLLHLFGPTGIGKTTLLKRFQVIHKGSLFIYLSGLEGYETKEQFLADLWEEIQKANLKTSPALVLNENTLARYLNELAEESGKVILLFDSFEQWSPLHKWLREKWIPLISLNVRFVTSSRFPFPPDWLRSPGWIGLIQSIELKGLNKQSVQEYLDMRGIIDKESRYWVEFYSKGVPLALRVICDIVELNGGVFLEEDEAFRYFIYSLSQQLLSASAEIIHHQELLTVTSLFWWFDFDLLADVSDGTISPGQFHQFCQLPYIELSENGCWRVNDAIRQWLSTELSLRNPEKYELFLKRATHSLKKKMDSVPAGKKLPFILNTLHVNQSGYVKRFGFSTSSRVFAHSPIKEVEIPIIMDMFRQYVLSLKPFLPDPWHQEQYFQDVWRVSAESFVGFRYHEKLAGFLVFVPLNEETRPLFLKNPVFHDYINRGTAQEKEFIIWVIAANPEFDPDVTGFILRYMFSNLAEDTLINVVSPFPDLTELFCSLGFQAADWYKKKYSNQMPMKFLQLDLRNKDLSAAIKQTLELAAPNKGINEMSALLKKFFTAYHKAESEENIHAIFVHFPLLERETSVAGFRRFITEVISQMEKGSEEDQTYAFIIKNSYIKKTTNHEALATRLNLSLSTYYRYLKKSIERVAYLLLEQCSEYD